MSDLSPALNALARSRTQLPVSSYFDEVLYQQELERIFQSGPRYLGHAVAIPEVGDYHTLSQEGEGRVLVRTAAGIELLSNVCRHRQALMLRGRGNTRNNIVCPLHRWTYSHQGELIGAPHFDHDPCLNLNNYKVRNWNGLLFEDNGRDIAADLAGPAWMGASIPAAIWISLVSCSTRWNCTSAITTGRPSSRSIWRTTTSAPSPLAVGTSSPARTFAGTWPMNIRYRPWAWPAVSTARARQPTASGTRKCSSSARAASPSRGRSG